MPRPIASVTKQRTDWGNLRSRGIAAVTQLDYLVKPFCLFVNTDRKKCGHLDRTTSRGQKENGKQEQHCHLLVAVPGYRHHTLLHLNSQVKGTVSRSAELYRSGEEAVESSKLGVLVTTLDNSSKVKNMTDCRAKREDTIAVAICIISITGLMTTTDIKEAKDLDTNIMRP